jgi:hypothetical protein
MNDTLQMTLLLLQGVWIPGLFLFFQLLLGYQEVEGYLLYF